MSPQRATPTPAFPLAINHEGVPGDGGGERQEGLLGKLGRNDPPS